MTFTDYADKALEKLPNTKSAYLYKQEVIAKMTKRVNELVDSGLSDNKVINQLVISEFQDIEKEYYNTVNKKKSKAKVKKAAKLSVLGVFGYITLLVVFFLAISFVTGLWGKTWLILVVGILIPVAAGMMASAFKAGGKSTVLSFASRILVSGAIFIVATVGFLVMIVFGMFAKSWLIFLGAVALSLVADCALAFACKQKSAIISLVLYLPVIATMIYVILGILGLLAWHPGWIVIVLAVVADIAILAARIVVSSKKEEEDEKWDDI